MSLLAVSIEDVEALWTGDPESPPFNVKVFVDKEPADWLELDEQTFRHLHTCMTRLLEMYETRHMTTRRSDDE